MKCDFHWKADRLHPVFTKIGPINCFIFALTDVIGITVNIFYHVFLSRKSGGFSFTTKRRHVFHTDTLTRSIKCYNSWQNKTFVRWECAWLTPMLSEWWMVLNQSKFLLNIERLIWVPRTGYNIKHSTDSVQTFLKRGFCHYVSGSLKTMKKKKILVCLYVNIKHCIAITFYCSVKRVRLFLFKNIGFYFFLKEWCIVGSAEHVFSLFHKASQKDGNLQIWRHNYFKQRHLWPYIAELQLLSKY